MHFLALCGKRIRYNIVPEKLGPANDVAQIFEVTHADKSALLNTLSLLSCAGAALFAGTGLPGIFLAANAADIAVYIVAVHRPLYEWYERGRFPWSTLALACTSAGLALLFLKEGSRIDPKLKIK